MVSSASLPIALSHAIAYLTRPLSLSYPSATIVRLQSILEANLTPVFSPTWSPREPLRGSGRRCLTLSPDCLPPRPIYSACIATGVQWFDWMALLGGREFDLFVDPGCVAMRLARKSEILIIWSDDRAAPSLKASSNVDEVMIQAHLQAQLDARARLQRQSMSQQLLDDDDQKEAEIIFTMIADEVADPAWTPVVDSFPIGTRSSSSLSTFSSHSRSSSCSSTSSFYTSLSSSPESTASDLPVPRQSRRERARQARVYIDTSKNEVTPYDGGKTTVLTGGVMLGAKHQPNASKKTAKAVTTPTASNWHSYCA